MSDPIRPSPFPVLDHRTIQWLYNELSPDEALIIDRTWYENHWQREGLPSPLELDQLPQRFRNIWLSDYLPMADDDAPPMYEIDLRTFKDGMRTFLESGTFGVPS